MTLLPFFLTLALVPQEVELPLPGCKRCDFSGVVECKKHPKDLLAMEAEVLFCSIAAECKSCAGALRVDCTRCDGGPDSQAVEDRRKEVQAWLEKPRALDDFLGVPIPRLETEYLMVEGDVEVLRESKKKVTGHELLHRVARDGEKVCAMVAEHFGAKRKDYRSPLKLWFWEKAETHRKVMGHFLGSGSAGDFKWLGKEPRFSVHCADSTFQSDAQSIHTLGVHNIGHMLTSSVFTEMWIGDMGGGWFDSGSAHWYEESVFGRIQHHCIDEQVYADSFANGYWRAAIRKHLDRDGGAAILPALTRMQTGAMTAQQQALAWSFFDWLASQHPSHLKDILQGLKKRTPERDLFQKLLTQNMRQVEDSWRNWVAETYPKKEPRRRR